MDKTVRLLAVSSILVAIVVAIVVVLIRPRFETAQESVRPTSDSAFISGRPEITAISSPIRFALVPPLESGIDFTYYANPSDEHYMPEQNGGGVALFDADGDGHLDVFLVNGSHFSYAAVGAPVKEGAVVGVGQGGGLLGAAFDPFAVYDDPTHPLRLEAFSLPNDVTLSRLKDRVDLRSLVDARLSPTRSTSATSGAAERQTSTRSFDIYYERALSLIQSRDVLTAFRLDDESRGLRERFGLTRFGQSCLLARRLIEAGTRFVQVTWPARSDDEPAAGPDGSWDTHRNNFPMLRDHRCPVFDHSLSALVEDLHQRGVLERTLVIAIGEFGRSPKIGAPTTNNVGPGGRDHWPDCYSCLIAPGGTQPGRTYGESDRFGAYPKSQPVHPYDLICTVYHALGIDPDTEYRDTLDRPRRLTAHGRPITGLF